MKKKDVDLLLEMMAQIIWLNTWIGSNDKKNVKRINEKIEEIYKKLVS